MIFALGLAFVILFYTNNLEVAVLQQTVMEADFALDTFVSVQIFYDANGFGNLEEQHRDIAARAVSMVHDYENMLSMHRENTDIWRINNAGGLPVEVSAATIEVINISLALSELTNGAFDITIGALTRLWDNARALESIPDYDEIQLALTTIGTEVIIDGNFVQLAHPLAAIDLGAIGKGFIGNRVRDFLQDYDVAAIINLGGEVTTLGQKPDGTPWAVGLQVPFAGINETFAVMHLNEASMATSGKYQRFFYYNNEFFHHILDPETGHPVKSELASVTIVNTGEDFADGLPTALFIMDTQEGLDLINSLENIEVVFIFNDGSWLASDGVGTYIPFQVMQ